MEIFLTMTEKILGKILAGISEINLKLDKIIERLEKTEEDLPTIDEKEYPEEEK